MSRCGAAFKRALFRSTLRDKESISSSIPLPKSSSDMLATSSEILALECHLSRSILDFTLEVEEGGECLAPLADFDQVSMVLCLPPDLALTCSVTNSIP